MRLTRLPQIKQQLLSAQALTAAIPSGGSVQGEQAKVHSPLSFPERGLSAYFAYYMHTICIL